MLRSCVIALAVLAAASSPTPRGATRAPERYVSTAVDTSGRLTIVTADHRTIVLEPDSGQVGVEQVAISMDRQAVGWLAMFENCCTSYPIPLALKVYERGRLHSFTGSSLPVWRWRFEAGGTRVSFEQETVHGGIGIHYELREIRTERLLAQHDPADSTAAPAWVARLDAADSDTTR